MSAFHFTWTAKGNFRSHFFNDTHIPTCVQVTKEDKARESLLTSIVKANYIRMFLIFQLEINNKHMARKAIFIRLKFCDGHVTIENQI